MSFLAPLYFVGALAVLGPIVFHLIRRQPRGEVEFSSLMFLEETPPKLTRRSRLENWPLLLLRCLAILMLAFAFARPFFPSVQTDSVDGVTQALVLLVDQSASMRRNGVWEQVEAEADKLLEAAGENSLVSVIAFDSQPRTELTLRESAELAAGERSAAAKDAFERIEPSWEQTDLGNAIRFAADQAATLEAGAAASGDGTAAVAGLETRIVLLSDLQQGASVETLQGYNWPDRVWLDVKTVSAKQPGNASLKVMPAADSASPTAAGNQPPAASLRVQVVNSAGSPNATFRLRFDGEQEDASVVQVPAGQSRFVNVPIPGSEIPGSDKQLCLRLTGDGEDFDNAFYFVRPQRVEQRVLFVPTAEDLGSTPTGQRPRTPPRDRLDFYLRQIPWSDATRDVRFEMAQASDWIEQLDPATVPLVVLAEPPTDAETSDAIERFLGSGGRVLCVLAATEIKSDAAQTDATNPFQPALAALLQSPDLKVQPFDEDGFRLIASVNFENGLIAPLSEPGVNDFSNLRVWKHVQLSGVTPPATTVLGLDNGLPWLLERKVAAESAAASESGVAGYSGRLWILTSGWQPEESQFALSTKFVPIMLGMLGENRLSVPRSYQVGDPLDDDQPATEPGFQQLEAGTVVAVNMDLRESDTTPIDLNRLSEFGAVISSPEKREQEELAERALRDVELEAKQGWWQWILLGTMGLIAAETILSARAAGAAANAAEAS
jgi:hypothetical protein